MITSVSKYEVKGFDTGLRMVIEVLYMNMNPSHSYITTIRTGFVTATRVINV